ncbi:redox protein, regulator of disulfide bond formation (plasmid) [Paraburkholderia caribensis MBA4]|uniref:Redox protein, regulator of disulfide bond formation n=2 Tax=Burkholderiaceae TaxID=119060 RepID=A0A0P0RMV2_9BURK|nr:redox protein, regulator of disulfide bond formation [Paraburkholderia caribensis MBA4]
MATSAPRLSRCFLIDISNHRTMTSLNEYLVQKRAAWLAKRAAARKDPHIKANQLKANVRALGRSGVREIRIRDFQVISDSPEDFAGYNLGPASPELQLGVLGSCLTHITLIQAAERELRIDSIEVEVTGEQHPLAQQPGFEHVPIFPHNIRYTLDIVSPESPEAIRALHEAVEAVCPIFNLLKNPQTIEGELRHAATA